MSEPRDTVSRLPMRLPKWRSRYSVLTTVLLPMLSIVLALGVANVMLWVFDLGDVEIYNHNPYYGYLTQPNQWASPRGIPFHINWAGLRGPDFAPLKKRGTLRITFVGDSVTFGGGIVSDANTFVASSAAALRQMTGRKIDTVNIAAPGWGVQNMRAYIAQHGIYDADLVVWVLPLEDFYRPFSRAEGMPYRKPAFRLTFLVWTGLMRTLYGIRAKLDSYLPRGPKRQNAKELDGLLQRNIEAFKRAAIAVHNDGAKIVVVFFPEGSVPADAQLEAYRRYLATAKSLDAPTCDISQQIESSGGASLFYDGAHLNPRGHRVTGRLIAQCLARLEPSLFRVERAPRALAGH